MSLFEFPGGNHPKKSLKKLYVMLMGSISLFKFPGGNHSKKPSQKLCGTLKENYLCEFLGFFI